MSPTFTADPIPFTTSQDGVIRVGGTRVTLDTIVYAFRDGASAEEVLLRYPALKLADIYAAITYYLRHPKAVDTYLVERETLAVAVRRENTNRFNPQGIRERLLARHSGGNAT